MDTGINGIDPPDWPPGCPTRKALDFLELALTNGAPNASYGDRHQGPTTSAGSRFEDLTLTLPLDGPCSARPSLHMLTSQVPEKSNQKPKLGSFSFDDLLMGSIRDALLNSLGQEDPDAPENTTIDRSLPLGLPPPGLGMPPLRSQPNGVLRLDCSIHAPLSSPTTGMDGVGEQTPAGPNRPQRPNKPQMPPSASEADSEPPEVVEGPPKRKRIIKIKSRAAVLYLREINKRDEAEANVERRIARGEAQPPSETARFDEATWHWDAGFEVPGGNSSLKESR